VQAAAVLVVARQATCNRPYAAGIQGFEQHGLGDEPRHATIAVRERVNPEKAMVRGGRLQNGLELVQA
jgi:hypothetical protein